MYAINRYFKKPLQQSAQLLLHKNQRVLTNPLLQQVFQYSKSHDGDDDDKGKPSKTKPSLNKKNLYEVDRLDKENDTGKTVSGKKGMPKEKKGPPAPKIELRVIPAMYSNMDYFERNIKMGSPLSPHLTIYKIQLTSVMSIFLRMSGFMLGLAIWIIGVSGLCCDMSIEALAQKIEDCECGRTIFNILKFFIVLPFAYHVVAGTRHLIWYLNVFLSKPHIYATGYAAIALTFLLAGGLSIIKPGEDNEKNPRKVDYNEENKLNIDNLVNGNVEPIIEDEQYDEDEELEKNIEH